MPMLAARAVIAVRHFLVMIFIKDSFRAVKKLMLVFFNL